MPSSSKNLNLVYKIVSEASSFASALAKLNLPSAVFGEALLGNSNSVDVSPFVIIFVVLSRETMICSRIDPAECVDHIQLFEFAGG